MPKGDMFSRYKPDSITQETWDAWMVEMFYNDPYADPTPFNSWWYNRVRLEALGKLVETKVVVPRRSEGHKKRKPGLFPWGTPDIPGSLATYGGLHYGTEFGWHREWKEAPRGRKFGWAGNFVLMLGFGREYFEYRRDFRAGGKTWNKWALKDFQATVYALIDEAERRKDYVTMVASPKRWMKDWASFWHDNLHYNMLNYEIHNRYFDRRGETIDMGVGTKKHNYWLDSHGRMTTALGGRVAPDRKGLIYNPTLDFWNYHIGSSYTGMMSNLANGWWVVYCPHCHNEMSQKTTTTWTCSGHGDMTVEQAVEGNKNYGMGEIAPPLFVNSTDYTAMKRLWLKLPNFGTGDFDAIQNTCMIPQALYQYLWANVGTFSKTEKATVIFIGQSHYPQMINSAWKYFELLKPRANIWFFDVGEQDRESYFFGEQAIRDQATHLDENGDDTQVPLMIKGGKRLFNYVYIENVANLTQTVLQALRRVR